MQFLKKVGQPSTKGNLTRNNDYEIKTFTTNLRNRSPMATNSYYSRRSPIKKNERTVDSIGGGEMMYVDPNEVNFRPNEEQHSQMSNNYIMRSPGEVKEEQIPSYRNEYERSQIETSQHMGYTNTNNRIPQFSIDMDKRRERMSRSPKTINLGETAQEAEYNIRTIRERSPKVSRGNSPQDNLVAERSYNVMSETGNIFLDQPMQQGSFARQNEIIGSPGYMQQTSYEMKGSQDMGNNSREIKFAMNPRDLQEPMPGILQKMSPHVNVDGESDSGSDKNDNVNQIKDLKTQLDNRRSNVILKNDDGMVEGRRIPNEMDKIEDMVRLREMQENITGEEVKKLVRQYVKAYDPRKDQDGNLISTSQTVLQSTKDDMYNERYKVLQKMNKLSNILLSKNRNTLNETDINLNRSYGEKTFDKKTLNSTVIGGQKRTLKRKPKFLYISLAMLSKGLNAEDKTILRWQRIDKGGVVDLAQEQIRKKEKYKIRKMKAKGRAHNLINPKYKEKAAKIVQAWWRERKEKYKKILDQIIKIQSVWRGKFTRKYVYDIIFMSYLHQKFLDIMSNTLVGHVRPRVWNALFSRKKLAKETLANLLTRKDDRFSALRIRPYFLRWDAIANFLKRRILKSEKLVIKKGDDEQRKKLLKKYLDEWILRTNLDKYIGKAKDAEEKKQKFFGTINLINGLSNFSKRIVQKNTQDPIKNYLKELLRQKLLTKIVNNTQRNNYYIKLRYYLNKWRDAINKGKLKDFKTDVFAKNVTRVHSRMDKIKLKKYFDRWRRQVPRGKRILDINEGAEILKRFALRTTFMDPLNAFSEKIDNENEREASLKILIMKRRNLKNNLRDYFNRWKNNTVRLNDKDYRNEIFATLLKNIASNYERRILYKRFNQWRQRPKVDVHGEMSKIKNFEIIIKKIFQNNLYPDKEEFLEKLSKTRADRTLKNAGGKIFKNYGKKDKNLLKYYFYKWRKQINKDQISDLHKQLLKALIINKQTINNRNLLYKYFTRWRLFVGDKRNYDNMDKLKKVGQGGDLLSNIHHRRIRDFITRLYRKMGKDYRPKIVKDLVKKLDMPRSNVRECFDRWRRICEKQRATENMTILKGKFINIGVKNVKERSNRDLLMKAFFKWKILCRKPEEYYPKITKGLDLLIQYFKKNLCDEPFSKISYYRNFTRPLNKIIKNYRNQENRLLNGKLRNLFGRWRKLIGDENIKDLKTNIIYKTKHYLNNNMKMKLLAKYFTRWKLYRKKGLDVNFIKGIDTLTNIFKNNGKQDIFDAFKYKIDKISKNKGAGGLARVSENQKNKLLHNALYKWYRNAMNTDPNRLKKIKTRLRRFIKRNEEEPRAKAFFKWRNKIKMLQFRDKDLLRAKKIIGNTLRMNDKKTLNYYMSTWKKKVQQIREEYLKSLLVKQIKTSQIVKEQITNESRLRSALLKWRSKLVPIDYLDRLKQIRKGCKLFKRGLKKRDERQIFDNINELAKYNRKNNLLKIIINEINPEIAKYHMKRCFDVWKSKVPDTQRMKNKIKLLFEDYLYSDKVHDGLFKNPKEDIVNLFKQYYDKKKNAAEKISKFAKNINLVKKYREKMLGILKLNKILNNKEKALNEIKRIQFIRYYRQTQKVKNDENARIIQKFIKEKLRRYFDKKKLIQKGAETFNIFIIKKVFKNIKDKAKDNYTTKVLKNTITRQEKANNDTLRNAFNKWRNIIPEIKKDEAANKIINLFRVNKSKNVRDNLRLRITKLINIYENYEDKNKKKLYWNLHEWLRRALVIKNNENAKIIQAFCRMKMNQHNEKVAKEKLRDLFKKDTKHKLAIIMERASRIIGGKGEVLYKALQDILYRNPFDKFMDNLKFLAQVNTLRKIQPKIHEKLREYYIPKYLKKWKENTYDVTVRQTKILQKFLRDQYAKKMERDRQRREELLIEIVKRKQKNNLYKLQLPFNIWSKKTKLAKMNESATKIQNMFRNYLAKEKAKDLSCQNKWKLLIRKIIYRNTVDGLKNAGTQRNLRINQKKILTIIFEKKIFDDGQSSLKRYMDKWKRYVQYYNKNVNKIQNNFRVYLANKEKNRLKRINEILKKTVIKTDKTLNDTLRSKLRKWNNRVKLIDYNENSRIIQRFIRPKLARLLFNKFQNFFYDNGTKKAIKLLVLAGKMNKLLHALNRPSVQRFRNNFEKISTNNKINENLRNLVAKTNNKNNQQMSTRYFHRWVNIIDALKNKENDSASIIQRAFLRSKALDEKNRLKRIKELLTKITVQKHNISNNKLYIYFTRWLSNTRIMAINENARIIQDFCRGIMQRCKEQKDLNNKLRMNKGILKLGEIKFGKDFIVEKIKSEINRNKFKKFNDDLKKHKLNTLKECFDKIKKTAFDNKLKNALKVPDTFRKRILKKIIIIWKENTDKVARNQAANTIINNWRKYNLKIKKENRDEILRDIFIKLYNKNSDIQNKYFNRWRDITNKIKENFAKRQVAKYLEERFRISNARNNWKKLSKNILLKNRNNDLFELINRTKKYIYLNRLKNPLVEIARKKFLTKLKDDKRKEDILDKLDKIIPRRDDTNTEIILRKYLLKWNEQKDKLNKRENNLRKAMDEIEKRMIKTDVEKINDAMLVHKFNHDLPYIRSKLFFSNLRKNAEKKNKYENLAKTLENADNELKNHNKQKLLNKILKLFAYKKIEGLVNACNDYDKNIIKPKYGKEFLQKLFVNMTNTSQYNYENRIDSTNRPKTTKLLFKKKLLKNDNNKIIEDKQAPIKKCLPGFVAYLDKKIQERNQNSLNEIKRFYASNKFCYLLKKFSNKKILPPKEDVIEVMKREKKYSQTRPLYQVKLFKLLRKKYIREITTKLEEPSRLYKLFYLINVTQMHKKITSQRFFREMIRKWRFIAFTKKMARRKLELMYKNLHASYMQMADEIFGDDEVNPSVIKQFEMFGNNVGMFTAQEPEVGEELKKRYYTTVDKRYVFKNDGSANSELRKTFTKEQIITEKQEVEEEEKEVISERRPINKDLSHSFREVKTNGFQRKYFKKGKEN